MPEIEKQACPSCGEISAHHSACSNQNPLIPQSVLDVVLSRREATALYTAHPFQLKFFKYIKQRQDEWMKKS